MNYIEGLEAIEEDEKACVDNRLLLEKAWQIIANEFYDAKGQFSQAFWAEQLLGTLKVMTCPPGLIAGLAQERSGLGAHAHAPSPDECRHAQ